MAPMQYALAIYAGDSARWQFALWADAAKTQPVDLTGVAVAALLSQGGRGLTPLVCTVAANVITVALSAATSQQLAAIASQWDLQLTYPSGDVQTIVQGPVAVTLDITRVPVTARELRHA